MPPLSQMKTADGSAVEAAFDAKMPSVSASTSSAGAKKKTALKTGWYQATATLNYTIYAKALSKGRVVVSYHNSATAGEDGDVHITAVTTGTADIVTVTMDLTSTDDMSPTEAKQFSQYRDNLQNVDTLADGSVVHTHRVRLFAPVLVDKCRVSVNKFKVTLTLAKAESAVWDSVSASLPSATGDDLHVDATGVAQPWTTKKDWGQVDKLAELELAAEKPEGDAAMHSLFQQIYESGSDDQKRAMMKSFQTSGGTVLSTNWDDVKDKDYEGRDRVLPTGQDVKKWEF